MMGMRERTKESNYDEREKSNSINVIVKREKERRMNN